MLEGSRDMLLNDPMQHLCELVEDVGHRLCTKDEHSEEEEASFLLASL